MSVRTDEAFERWFRRPQPAPAACAHLICFPHAGGTAGFYRRWSRRLPADLQLLAVQYPGREDRMREPFVDDLHRLADQVAAALAPALDRPVALFGHSMGAAVAYEVARRIEAGGHEVAHLIVSGRPAPGRQRDEAKHLLPDDELWAELRRLGGTSAPVLDFPELRRLVLPCVRSDYRLSEAYRPRQGAPLECAVMACLGDRDPEVSVDEALGWAAVTRGPFALRVFPGDHFYLTDGQAELLAEVVRSVATARERGD